MSTKAYLIGQGYDNLRKHGAKTFSTMLIICATMFVLGLFILLFVNVDSNVAYKNYPLIIKSLHLNNF